MNFDEILRKIARNNNTTTEQVYADMQEAINAAYLSNDPAIKERWKSLGFTHCPTPEEFLPVAVFILGGSLPN